MAAERTCYTAVFKCFSTSDSSLPVSFNYTQKDTAESVKSRTGTDFSSVDQTAWGNLQGSQHTLETLKRGLIGTPRP